MSSAANVHELIARLRDCDVEVRRIAAGRLWFSGPEVLCQTAEVVVPALIEALRDEDSHVQYQAMEALDEMDVRAKGALTLTLLRSVIEDPCETVRSAARRLLSRMEEVHEFPWVTMA